MTPYVTLHLRGQNGARTTFDIANATGKDFSVAIATNLISWIFPVSSTQQVPMNISSQIFCRTDNW